MFKLNRLPTLNLIGYKPPSISTLSNLFQPSMHKTVPEVSGDRKKLQKVPDNDQPQDCAQVDDTSSSDETSKGMPEETASMSTSCAVTDHRPRWSNYKVYRSKGLKISSPSDLMSARELGNVVITDAVNGNVPEYGKITALLQNDTFTPFVDIKKAEFASLVNSPRRFLKVSGNKKTTR